MPHGTHDEVRMWAAFVLLLAGVRRLPRTAVHKKYTICVRLSPVRSLVGVILAGAHRIRPTAHGQLHAPLSPKDNGQDPAPQDLPGPVSLLRNLRGSTSGIFPLGVT